MWPFCGHNSLQIVRSELMFFVEPYKERPEADAVREEYFVYHTRCYDCDKIFYERHRRV